MNGKIKSRGNFNLLQYPSNNVKRLLCCRIVPHADHTRGCGEVLCTCAVETMRFWDVRELASSLWEVGNVCQQRYGLAMHMRNGYNEVSRRAGSSWHNLCGRCRGGKSIHIYQYPNRKKYCNLTCTSAIISKRLMEVM